jgi:ribosomal protein L11 methyltransferase
MNKPFLQITWPVFLSQNEAEFLISYLSELGFEAFHEDDNEFRAYVEKSIFDEQQFKEVLAKVPVDADLTNYLIENQEDKNWNEEWESNFHPVYIGDMITVRAPFHHIEVSTPYEIIIQPKMSFGTGHHETTAGMMEMMCEQDFKGKSVIDMGCGTAILSVLAEKLGAHIVIAIDNDPVCTENSAEIISLNHCKYINVNEGDAETLKTITADILLANINRNILLNDIHRYRQVLFSGGLLMLSGFYTHDFAIIDEECRKNGFSLSKQLVKNNWTICLYKVI